LASSPSSSLSVGPPFVAQPKALAADLDDVRMVQQAIERGGGQRLIVGEGTGPLRERQIAGQHDRAGS
jgi:hypothetical protein